MSSTCTKSYGNAAPTVTTCPSDTDRVLFVDDAGLCVFRAWSTLRNCLATDFFGSGAIYITGEDLDSEGVYLNSSLPNDLLLFYNGLPKFMIPSTEWVTAVNGDGDVVGIKILTGVAYTSDDVFVIIPSPKST